MKTVFPDFQMSTIAIAHTPFSQRFGIPRQPGLAKSARGILKFNPDPDFVHALKGIEAFTHIWIVFVFHEHGGNKWKPTIRPPRLGGKTKMGVLASRSPHRPNPIGLSVVEIERIDLEAVGGPEISVKGVDLLDGTPILDVKPYLPYADAIPDAGSGWASEPIVRHPVTFLPEAEKKLQVILHTDPDFRELAIDLLSIDPRPGFQKKALPPDQPESQGKIFGLLVKNHDIKWRIENGAFVVFDVETFG